MAGRVASVDLVPQAEGALDRDPLEAEGLVGQDLDPLALLERAVEAGDLGDLLGADLVALVAQALAHLGEQLAGIDELDLAPALGRLRLVTIQK